MDKGFATGYIKKRKHFKMGMLAAPTFMA